MNRNAKRILVSLFFVMLAFFAARSSYAQSTFATIYSFGKLPDGAQPHASLVIGPQGSLFGTTFLGGQAGYGTVFELSNPTGKAWIETVLYSFSGPPGAYPDANVVFGPGGAFYGTTQSGGNGGGTIFELAPPSAPDGAWTESVLFEFASGIHAEVSEPRGAVLFGTEGLLYTTAGGNSIGQYGGVVALVPPGAAGGNWKESTIFKFGTPLSAGGKPYAGLVTDGGHMYGTSWLGGIHCSFDFCGTVYELIPPSMQGSGWTAAPAYEFAGPPDGAQPMAPVTVGAGGVLFGTTWLGGDATVCTVFNAPGCGTVFQLTPPSAPGGTWAESVLHAFTGVEGDGAYPVSAVIVGPDGTLYGTTQYGGSATTGSPCSSYGVTGCGTVFELLPPVTPDGVWTEKILHSFTGQNGDGAIPQGGLIMSPSGVLYGTTEGGGANGKGTVFAIRP